MRKSIKTLTLQATINTENMPNPAEFWGVKCNQKHPAFGPLSLFQTFTPRYISVTLCYCSTFPLSLALYCVRAWKLREGMRIENDRHGRWISWYLNSRERRARKQLMIILILFCGILMERKGSENGVHTQFVAKVMTLACSRVRFFVKKRHEPWWEMLRRF